MRAAGAARAAYAPMFAPYAADVERRNNFMLKFNALPNHRRWN
jgi:hypothetical protein